MKLDDEAIHSRAFIVGCPRSGTTLLQAMIASHSRFSTVPETHFLPRLLGPRWPVDPERPINLVQRFRTYHGRLRRAVRQIDALASELNLRPPWPRGRAATLPFPSIYPWSLRPFPTVLQTEKVFFGTLDRGTLSASKDCWIEKSPPHLHYVKDIEQIVPEAQFIHILRDSRDVIASVYELCKSTPRFWLSQILSQSAIDGITEGSFSGLVLPAIVARWNHDSLLSQEYATRRSHLLVRYEELVTEQEAVLRRICAFLRIEFEREMLDHTSLADRVVGWRRDYPHMLGVYRKIKYEPRKKYQATLSEAERGLVENLLA